jgi:hypothetical protein
MLSSVRKLGYGLGYFLGFLKWTGNGEVYVSAGRRRKAGKYSCYIAKDGRSLPALVGSPLLLRTGGCGSLPGRVRLLRKKYSSP